MMRIMGANNYTGLHKSCASHKREYLIMVSGCYLTGVLPMEERFLV